MGKNGEFKRVQPSWAGKEIIPLIWGWGKKGFSPFPYKGGGRVKI
jgi:hypothetical protein